MQLLHKTGPEKQEVVFKIQITTRTGEGICREVGLVVLVLPLSLSERLGSSSQVLAGTCEHAGQQQIHFTRGHTLT